MCNYPCPMQLPAHEVATVYIVVQKFLSVCGFYQK